MAGLGHERKALLPRLSDRSPGMRRPRRASGSDLRAPKAAIDALTATARCNGHLPMLQPTRPC